jgi:hypothetical protein
LCRRPAKHKRSIPFACNKPDILLRHEYASRKRLRLLGSQSPKFPNVALARRARILAFAFWSATWESQTSKSDDRSNVFNASIVSDWILLRKRVAQAFPTPALRKGSEGRGTLCVADAGKIRSDGHPPATGAKSPRWFHLLYAALKGRSSTVVHTSASMGNLGTVPRLVPSRLVHSQVGTLT